MSLLALCDFFKTLCLLKKIWRTTETATKTHPYGGVSCQFSYCEDSIRMCREWADENLRPLCFSCMKISQKRKSVGEVHTWIIWLYSMFLRRGLILYLRLALNLKSSCFCIWMHDFNFCSPLASEVISAYYRLNLAMTQESPLSENEQHGENLHEGLTLEQTFAFVNSHHTGGHWGPRELWICWRPDNWYHRQCLLSALWIFKLFCSSVLPNLPQHCIVFF